MSIEKIPCTVQVFTLNCAHILRRCLESLKDFDEILILDGNSTDGTLEIAREFGATIIKQFDSDEPNLRIKDVAAMRNKAIDSGKYDWNLYIDSDEELPARTAEEIRQIVTNPKIEHYIYYVPNRIMFEGREIKHSVPYPGYQLRFLNRKSGIYHSRTPHSRPSFDPKKYPPGYLKNPWYVIVERGVRGYNPSVNYGHIKIEIEIAGKMPVKQFWGWIFKKSAGMVKNFLSSSFIYIRHGFKDTLPPSIELIRIKTKWLMVTGAIAHRFFGVRFDANRSYK